MATKEIHDAIVIFREEESGNAEAKREPELEVFCSNTADTETVWWDSSILPQIAATETVWPHMILMMQPQRQCAPMPHMRFMMQLINVNETAVKSWQCWIYGESAHQIHVLLYASSVFVQHCVSAGIVPIDKLVIHISVSWPHARHQRFSHSWPCPLARREGSCWQVIASTRGSSSSVAPT